MFGWHYFSVNDISKVLPQKQYILWSLHKDVPIAPVIHLQNSLVTVLPSDDHCANTPHRHVGRRAIRSWDGNPSLRSEGESGDISSCFSVKCHLLVVHGSSEWHIFVEWSIVTDMAGDHYTNYLRTCDIYMRTLWLAKWRNSLHITLEGDDMVCQAKSHLVSHLSSWQGFFKYFSSGHVSTCTSTLSMSVSRGGGGGDTHQISIRKLIIDVLTMS